MDRRDFLKVLAAAVPTVMLAPWASATPGAAGRVLVLVQLQGGNDGLNTVIPYSDPAYASLRPNLALGRDQVLQLDPKVGLHPGLEPLMASWRRGELALVQGLGYPNPIRSHFRSIDIWETASDSDEVLTTGWVTRSLAAAPRRELVADGVVIGHEDTGPLAGEGIQTLVMTAPEDFIQAARRLQAAPGRAANPALSHVLGVQREILRAADKLDARLRDAPAPTGTFPRTPLGRQLQVAAQLLAAGAPLHVIKVVHDGFDTHANQRARHDRLLGDLGAALQVFCESVKEMGRWDDVLIVTYSEFGRRIAENASGGTDHGTAAPHFMLGGRVKGGLHGQAPSLTRGDDGDLPFTTDFRRLYATVLDRWWGLPPKDLLGGAFAPLDLIK